MRFTPESIDEVAARLLAMDEHGLHVPEADLDRTRRIMANDEPHYGDCTKAPSTCVRCVAEEWREATERLVELLVPMSEEGADRPGVEAVVPGILDPSEKAARRDMIDRLRQGRGRDVGIDTELMGMLYVRERRSIGAEVETDNGWVPSKDLVWVDPTTDQWISTHPLEFTGDVMRAFAFADRIFPAAELMVLRKSARGSATPHRVEMEGRSGPCVVDHVDMPRAILIAALTASTE